MQNGQKWCHIGHRRFLPTNHRFQHYQRSFNGNDEHRVAPKEFGNGTYYFGENIKKQDVRKKKKHAKLEPNWKKNNILFLLPYWKIFILRQKLDVMRIEKKICDSIVDTLLSMEGKSKDNLNSFLDSQVMGIRYQLHAMQRGNKVILPVAC